ncbi:glutathione S-transferase family protein [Nordella sp. HKS 07]|uniref:glutathione S-transferase family protein n=1 Tax=Nordella sp. HKS 07 TaxID=2712222 RepID=UPI0013E117BE|nr:glutathione S-transferase family protein [Nordella sp. HKS 07]QIG51310.1 glutathione S-transferase family protein [Nordella sp. HKS 07]
MYKLYNVKRWGSLSAHLVLEELGVPYQNIWLTPEQVRAREFREISPLGLIPALGLPDGRAITESAAIVAFLTDAHPEAGLAPPIGSNDHAVYLSSLVLMATNIYPAIELAFDARALADSEEQIAVIRRKSVQRSLDLFGIIEARLAEDGPFVTGDSYSAADIYLFMLTIWGHPSEQAVLNRYPHIASVVAHVRARPRLKAALEAHGALEARIAEAA